MRRIWLLLLMVTAIVGCAPANNDKVQVTISAAASLQDALQEIKQIYEEENETVTIAYNFAGSGTLQQQIKQGAPVDLFFSADKGSFAELVVEGMMEEQVDLLQNELVLIVPLDVEYEMSSFEDLTDERVERIAIGIPESVPVGGYAQETLQAIEVWDVLQNKLILAKDARQVLSYVETGSVDAGIVYKTDALVSKKTRIVATAPKETHSPIIFPVGIMKDSKLVDEALAFYQYIQTEEATKIFEQYGFKVN